MSAASSVFSGEASRKRMRKGTHSCTECRRRKKSCVMPENGEKCTECRERGVECLSQDVRPLKQPRVESKQGLQERIVRLENVVQGIVDRLDMGSATGDRLDETAHQLRSDVDRSTPISDEGVADADQVASAPILSIFDNEVLSRREDEPSVDRSTNDSTYKSSRRDHKTERIRQTLLSLFPPPELEEQVLKSSMWWGPWHDMFPGIFGVDGSSTSYREFVLTSKASGNVQTIAKALLSLSLTLQEGKGFDEFLQERGMSSSMWNASDSKCGRNVDRIMKIIEELILSDNELASTIDGIECLILQAKQDSNKGRIRRSWIYSRRGLEYGQLLGLHRRPVHCPPAEAQRRGSLWKALYQGDRFMSLILGLPYGAAKRHCEMEQRSGATGPDYILRMANIAGDVLDRNLDPSVDGNYMDTVKIEGSLMDLANSMPAEWWRPHFVDGVDHHVQMCNRLLPQFWHHQIRALLHLPFMLKANQDRRYEYNRMAALESAREMIVRYLVLRPMQGYNSLICKVIDFQVFTAAMFLVLSLYGTLASSSKRNEEEDDRDWDLVSSTNEMLQHAAKATGGVVASQAARALGMFVESRGKDCPYSSKPELSCKVVIPCFGTVSFGPGKDFTRQCPSAQTPSGFSQVGLPTPADSASGKFDENPSSASDPFVSFDSYLAQMPFDFNFTDGHATQQSLGDFNTSNDIFANVNLDLDQDWTWYPAAEQAAPAFQ